MGDLCRLQHMGRQHLFHGGEKPGGPEWVHENEAALAFAGAMAGEGVVFATVRPGKARSTSMAGQDGLAGGG